MLEGDSCNLCAGNPKYFQPETAKVVNTGKELRTRRGLCDGDEVQDLLWPVGDQGFQLNFTRAFTLHGFHDLATLTGFVVLLP